jgi:CxxC-x17-CxxC domain-containing protein
MGNFRPNGGRGFSGDRGRPRSGGFSRGGRRFGGNRDGGNGESFGNGGRRSRSFDKRNGFNRGFGGNRSFGERRPVEMHEAICDKCKQQCKIPFKPTEGKPVYCSACFEQTGNSGSKRGSEQSTSGISKEQFAEINAKLDKIIEMLNGLEIVDDEYSEDEESEDNK